MRLIYYIRNSSLPPRKKMKKTPKISDAEWEVMKVLWFRSAATAETVIEALSKTNNWKPATIRTLINRLVKKGALSHNREGRAFIY
jgi:BlaI family penicillinase repressor